jgi:uncharacterized protein (DUF2147 family)
MSIIVSAFLFLGAVQATDEATIVGHWANSSGSVIVRIAPCGPAVCGHIVEASEAAKLDAMRAGTTTLVGTEVLTSFRPDGRGRWRGRLFVPDKALRTRARIVQLGPDALKVIACDLAGLICKRQTWRRTITP